MKRSTTRKTATLAGIGLFLAGAFTAGLFQREGASPLVPAAHASGGGVVQEGWSPTGVYPTQEVYYPGTEALAEDEIRVIACGSGMPMPRLNCKRK